MAIQEYGPTVLGWIKKPEHEKVLAAANANLARAIRAGEGVSAAEKYAKRVQASYNSKYEANTKDTMTASKRATAARLGKNKEFISPPPPPKRPTVPETSAVKPPPPLKSRAPKKRNGLEFTKKTKAELLAALDWETKRKQTARDNAAVERMGKEYERQQEQKQAPAPLPAQTVDKLTAVPAKTPTPLPRMKLSKPVVKAKLNNGKVTVSSTSNDVSSKDINKANKELKDKDGLTEGKFGTRAGTAAIKSFFRDTLGIEKDIEVDYTFPGEEGYGTPPEDRPKKTQSKKSGGKVTAKRTPTKRAAVKRPTTKKYAMNRGGKVASVRKPTRA